MSLALVSEYERALEDINKAYELEPNDDILAQIQSLEDAIANQQ